MAWDAVVRRGRVALVVLLVATGAAACSDDGDDGDGDVAVGGSASSTSMTEPGSSTTAAQGTPSESGGSVTMKDGAFEPKALTVKGSTLAVTLTNTGSAAHTFTIDDPRVDTTVTAGGTGQVVVALGSRKSVAFYCRFHRGGGMQGTITVSP